MNLKLKHLQALKGIALLALSSLIIAGCGPESSASLNPEAVIPEKPRVEVSTGWSPTEDAPVMLNGDRKLSLHASEDDTFKAFPRPRGAFDFFEESPIQGDGYVGKGWQSNAEAFGGLFLRDKLVLGLYTVDKIDGDTLSDKVRVYEQAFAPVEPEFVTSEYASYWFWEVGQTRLMICNSRDAKRNSQLVVAIGDVDIMNALRMSKIAANQDLTETRAKMSEMLESSQK